MGGVESDAAAFIGAAVRNHTVVLPEFTQPQRDFVSVVLAHNDSTAVCRLKRGAVATHKYLKANYAFAHGQHVFVAMVCAAFGRKTWAKK